MVSITIVVCADLLEIGPSAVRMFCIHDVDNMPLGNRANWVPEMSDAYPRSDSLRFSRRAKAQTARYHNWHTAKSLLQRTACWSLQPPTQFVLTVEWHWSRRMRGDMSPNCESRRCLMPKAIKAMKSDSKKFHKVAVHGAPVKTLAAHGKSKCSNFSSCRQELGSRYSTNTGEQK